MKCLCAAFLVVLMATAAWAAGADAAPAAATGPGIPTIFVCGDSTAKYAGSETVASEMQGWGTPLATLFDPAKVKISNVGHAGTSSLTYYQGDWPRVQAQIRKGDYVLIVFGINDGGRNTPNGTGDEVVQGPAGPETHTYGWYMGKMATDARDKGAMPVFLTVTASNIWTNPKVKFNDATPTGPLPADYDAKQDKIERGTGNGRYGEWTKEVGKKLHVPVFDLTDYCADEYEALGREKVNTYYKDHNHTYGPGAEVVAEAVTSGLKGLKDSAFEAMLSEKGKKLPTAEGKYISDNVAEAAASAPPKESRGVSPGDQ